MLEALYRKFRESPAYERIATGIAAIALAFTLAGCAPQEPNYNPDYPLAYRTLDCEVVKAIGKYAGRKKLSRTGLDEKDRKRAVKSITVAFDFNTRPVQECRGKMLDTLSLLVKPADKKADDFFIREAVDVLMHDLESGKPRFLTIRALGELREKRAVPYLKIIISNKNADSLLFNTAYFALSNIGDPSAAPYMLMALTNTPNKFFDKRDAVQAYGGVSRNIRPVLDFAMQSIRSGEPVKNEQWIYFIIERGSYEQKSELAEILMGAWAREFAGRDELIKIGHYLVELSKTSGRRTKDEIALTFYTSIIHLEKCYKHAIALSRLERMVRDVSSEYASLYGKAQYNREACLE